MKPYGLRSKLKYNYKDNHPQKGYVNWWEIESKDISKKRERFKQKKILSWY